MKSPREHVLLVEDDDEIATALSAYLNRAGFSTQRTADGLSALDAFSRSPPDIVLLDLMLPMLSGFEVLAAIREQHDVPVIVLTASAFEGDTLHGFRLGADDYVTKPFRPLEVVARVEAVLRRANPPTTALSGRDGLRLEPRSRRASRGGATIDLTPSEFTLLQAFLRDPGRAWSRAQLAALLGGKAGEASERAVDSHVKNLRRKLGETHGIEMLYGMGYRYAAA